ncbi:MAG: universal stress protein [Alphaproteobacteria bacterium]|nr:universal stress protein [Alphaproteobacteria bacterium]
MSFKNLLVHVDNTPGALIRAHAAAALAKDLDATARAFVVSVTPGEPFGPGAAILDDSIHAMRGVVAHRRTVEARAALEVARDAAQIDGDILQVDPDRVIVDAATHMRAADLVVLGPPRMNGQWLDDDLIEAALFCSGRPVIVFPQERNSAPFGRRIAIAWKDCREAARAVHDALPLLVKADSVQFVAVHAQDDPRYFGGAALERMEEGLRAHGVNVGVAEIVRRGRSTGEAVEAAARGVDADLVVMGAYGRWRLSEMLFGGVTRDMLATLATPLFLSH